MIFNNRDEFLEWEKVQRDAIDVKRIYIRLAGGLVAGVLLSQILYWHLESKQKNFSSKLRVKKKDKGDGQLYEWLVKRREDWWDECGITVDEFDNAVKELMARGLVKKQIHRFNTFPTIHLRIMWDVFLQQINEMIELQETGIELPKKHVRMVEEKKQLVRSRKSQVTPANQNIQFVYSNIAN